VHLRCAGSLLPSYARPDQILRGHQRVSDSDR